MPFVDESSLTFSKRALRCSGASLVVRTLGALAIAFIGTPPASAQNVPGKPPLFPLSLPGKKPAAGTAYVGDQACSACHQDKSGTYPQTAHFKTSSLASGGSIHGSFGAGSNILRTANPNLYFQMEARGKEFFQTGVLRTSAEVLTRSERFDLVVGSGRKGQTYLFWDGDGLFQLPVSYWTELGAWVNSPGYLDGAANFDRPIPARCLECHSSSFESRAPPENLYNKSSLVLGISCEKCHGPGEEHVTRYRSGAPPRSLLDAAIINPARLSRGRQIDLCSLCHAGLGNPLTPPLSFTPGEVLANHLVFPKQAPDAPMDVHASQVQLLERSRCFQATPTMTCASCHDVHKPQRDLAALASRCLTCHKVESCPTYPKLGHKIDLQCVACHMPLQETAQIIISIIDGKSLQPKVRNHRIGIYPDIHLP